MHLIFLAQITMLAIAFDISSADYHACHCILHFWCRLLCSLLHFVFLAQITKPTIVFYIPGIDYHTRHYILLSYHCIYFLGMTLSYHRFPFWYGFILPLLFLFMSFYFVVTLPLQYSYDYFIFLTLTLVGSS